MSPSLSPLFSSQVQLTQGMLEASFARLGRVARVSLPSSGNEGIFVCKSSFFEFCSASAAPVHLGGSTWAEGYQGNLGTMQGERGGELAGAFCDGGGGGKDCRAPWGREIRRESGGGGWGWGLRG